ncbi:MAG: beta-N-acetylhexosaminidase [Arcanobacterium sp.]|nr:beta-N-acetylhexosaminidase [Arcanobacterium sp.]
MIALVPQPRIVREQPGELVIQEELGYVAGDGAFHSAIHLIQERLWNGAKIRVNPATAQLNAARAALTFQWVPDIPNEGYSLDVSREGIRIAASSSAGAYYAAESLIQLCDPEIYREGVIRPLELRIPAVHIEDCPKFIWRGLLIDVARHFLPKRELFRVIEVMALHKFNRLHLHLTDDQGWRPEIKAFPNLTRVGSWRKSTQFGADDRNSPETNLPHGGYYTQEELREIVAFAAERAIEVIPEIDVPGHSQAAIAAYPQLGLANAANVEVWSRFGVSPYPLNAEDSTIDFYATVLGELAEIFSSPLMCIGGDEVPSDAWAADARARQRTAELGLSHPRELQQWFVNSIAKRVVQLGKVPMEWDDVLAHGVAAGAEVNSNGSNPPVILAWRGDRSVQRAIDLGFRVVSCPDTHAYLSYRQSALATEPTPVGIVLTTQDVYNFDPVPRGCSPEAQWLVLGGQGNLWAEHLDDPRRRDYMLWPRACALAETLWSGTGDYSEFSVRLTAHLQRLDAVGIEYRHEQGPYPWQERPGAAGRKQTLAEREAEISNLLSV